MPPSTPTPPAGGSPPEPGDTPAGPQAPDASGAQPTPSVDTPPDELLERWFGPAAPAARAYADRLVTAGLERGLLGPREAPRIWTRHILNCLPVAELIPADRTVCDLGAGAGLPGIVVALARPDLQLTLLEPLLRRTTFLQETVDQLGLANVTVLRGRAEDVAGQHTWDVVTARAVAPIDRLARWSAPLLVPQGVLLALKGDSAADELSGAAASLQVLGAESWRTLSVGEGLPEGPVTVAEVRFRADRVVVPGRPGPGGPAAGQKRARQGAGRRRRKGSR